MKQALVFLLLLAIFGQDVICRPQNASEPEGKSFDVEILKNSQPQYNHRMAQTYSIPRPMDCSEVRLNGNTKNGFYTIHPKSRTINCNSFVVYCDMESDGTGWTVIQRRGDYKNPVNYFSKTWSQYKKGFGSLEKEFWLGNDRIHALTNQASYKIRFDMRHPNGTFVRDEYETFWIDDESQKYTIHITEYTGNGSDAMEYHNNKKFTTKDKDNSGNSCGSTKQGGWWFGGCVRANLNGLNTQGNVAYDLGIHWGGSFTGWTTSLVYTEMKIQATTL